MNHRRLKYMAINAHKLCTNNRTLLERADRCGCFCCGEIYAPSQIEEWVPEVEDGPCVTAVCPICNVDSVIPDTQQYPVDKPLLSKMRRVWFKFS